MFVESFTKVIDSNSVTYEKPHIRCNDPNQSRQRTPLLLLIPTLVVTVTADEIRHVKEG
jgi:hypothetical protein